MRRYYKQGRLNSYQLHVPGYRWSVSTFESCLETARAHARAKKLGSANFFVKMIIVRGIGYRVFSILNDAAHTAPPQNGFIRKLRPLFTCGLGDEALEITQSTDFELPYCRYLTIRAGHTRDLFMPLRQVSKVLTFKKDRKLVVASSDPIAASNIGYRVWRYRRPSVYTGRGARVKHASNIRKAGKKDQQKGTIF